VGIVSATVTQKQPTDQSVNSIEVCFDSVDNKSKNDYSSGGSKFDYYPVLLGQAAFDFSDCLGDPALEAALGFRSRLYRALGNSVDSGSSGESAGCQAGGRLPSDASGWTDSE
jgi:hypothetical protein